MDNSTHNMDPEVPTKLSKFPTPFSIESLIANHHQKTANKASGDPVTEELRSRAMVASSALGLTNFALYNPWLHGYFAQNHERITQLFANGEYVANSLRKEQSTNNTSPSNSVSLPQRSSPSKSSDEFETQLQTRFLIPGFGLGMPNASNVPSMSLNDSILQQSENLASDLSSSRQKLAELMACGLTTENVQNLSIANRFAQNMGKVFNEASLSSVGSNPIPAAALHLYARQESSNSSSQHPSEASLDVGGMDEDYDCSGDSCSDISLTMSPQNYKTEVDTSRGKSTFRNNELDR